MTWTFLTLCITLYTTTGKLTQAQSPPDNRCYLENGASSESFFVPEDLPVGSNLGQIRIHGDPLSISLRLRELDSPVTLTSFRNLTLRRSLDKEGLDGPASVFVNLLCERMRTLDPVFVIPISIRVTDVNDNVPKFINSPYVLNISEVTVVGTRVLQGVHAVDADQQGANSNVRYSVLPGLQADFFEFVNELEGTLVLKRPLDYESLRSFNVQIRAQDHGEPPKSTETSLTVYVVDADDQNPKFLDDKYESFVQEPGLLGSGLVVKPREIKAFDQDLGINAAVFYTFNGVGVEYAQFKIGRQNGRISLARDLMVDELRHPVTLVIRATQQDNLDRYALATLTVSRTASNPVRFFKRTYIIPVSESTAIGTTLAVLTNTKTEENLQYFVSDKDVLETFAISSTGRLSLKKLLDYESQTEYVFRVFATDGVTNDSSLVNVTVEDVNEWDPQFRYSQYEFYVFGVENDPIGRVEVGDGDTKDQISLSLVGVNASLFYVTPNGDLRLRKLEEHKGDASLAVVASDNGNPPRRVSAPVLVHFQNGPEKSVTASSSVFLGALSLVLFLLMVVIAGLVVYICKVRNSPTSQQLGPLKEDPVEKVSNPMYGDATSKPAAKAKPSPKIHPAPLPPLWPPSAIPPRVKKLSWNDDNGEIRKDADDVLEEVGKVTDSSNLTVYF